jgi:hypothetical protein
MSTLNEALASLCPLGRWTISGDDPGYGDIVWLTEEYEQPPQAAVEAAAEQIEAEKRRVQYQQDRKPLYPKLEEFADAYYWAQNGDTTKMQEYLDKVSAVKAQFPKAG